MSTFVAIEYDAPHKAQEVRLTLGKLQREYLIDLEDAVVAAKNVDVKIQTPSGSQSYGSWRSIGMVLGLSHWPVVLQPVTGGRGQRESSNPKATRYSIKDSEHATNVPMTRTIFAYDCNNFAYRIKSCCLRFVCWASRLRCRFVGIPFCNRSLSSTKERSNKQKTTLKLEGSPCQT